MHRRTGLAVGLLSLTVIGVELIWMRLFSAEFYHAFAFLTLSLAVPGLGLGALGYGCGPASPARRTWAGCWPRPVPRRSRRCTWEVSTIGQTGPASEHPGAGPVLGSAA